MMPGNAADKIDSTTKSTRTSVEFQPKRRAMPPITPASSRSLRERERVRGAFMVWPPTRIGTSLAWLAASWMGPAYVAQPGLQPGCRVHDRRTRATHAVSAATHAATRAGECDELLGGGHLVALAQVVVLAAKMLPGPLRRVPAAIALEVASACAERGDEALDPAHRRPAG